MKTYKTLYHLLLLPIILLAIAYFLLITNITDGNIIEALLAPWGTALILMIVSQIYLEAIFTSPRYALVNSLNALVIGLIILHEQHESINYWIITFYALTVFITSIAFFLFYEKQRKINVLTKFSSIFGSAIVLFPLIAILQFTKFSISLTEFKIAFESKSLFLILCYYFIFRILTTLDIPS